MRTSALTGEILRLRAHTGPRLTMEEERFGGSPRRGETRSQKGAEGSTDRVAVSLHRDGLLRWLPLRGFRSFRPAWWPPGPASGFHCTLH